ncbi:MAG TPA: hypothetical protein VGN07_10720 [Steroidobacteraceae bacterium]
MEPYRYLRINLQERSKMFTPSSHRYSLVVGIAAGLIAMPTAFAADQDGQRSSANAELKMMDTNQDGKISAVEHAAGARQMFVLMDADKDGKVTAAEMDAAHSKMGGHADNNRADNKSGKQELSSAQKIKVVDTDGDGVLTAAEHASGSEKMFASMDVDKDGSLTAAEIQSGHEALMRAKSQ